jgi:hypothetical protein
LLPLLVRKICLPYCIKLLKEVLISNAYVMSNTQDAHKKNIVRYLKTVNLRAGTEWCCKFFLEKVMVMMVNG